MNNDEKSKGGSNIYRYEAKEIPFVFADGDSSSIEQIEQHIEKYVGKSATVFHELISSHIHIDVHVVEPTPEKNYYTLITSGMSDKPMNSPIEEFKYAELMVCLPSDWKLNEKDFQDNNNYWVIQWMKKLARFPHEYNTWLWESHTVPNGDPPQPFASNTKLCCVLFSFPMLFGDEFRKLKVNEDKTIHFLSFIPLYKEEMQFKLDKGMSALYDKFDENDLSELLNIDRPNLCKKKLFGFW